MLGRVIWNLLFGWFIERVSFIEDERDAFRFYYNILAKQIAALDICLFSLPMHLPSCFVVFIEWPFSSPSLKLRFSDMLA